MSWSESFSAATPDVDFVDKLRSCKNTFHSEKKNKVI